MAGAGILPAGAAAVLLDGAGNAYALTDEARHILDGRGVLELRGARLHALDGDDDKRLQSLIETCTRGDLPEDMRGKVRCITLPGRPAQLQLCFTTLTAQLDQGTPNGPAPGALALINSSPDVGLTAAENAVADSLWNGLPLRTIAEHRGTSVETVRTQVKAIYAKLGVRGRAQMMARLTHREVPVELARQVATLSD